MTHTFAVGVPRVEVGPRYYPGLVVMRPIGCTCRVSNGAMVREAKWPVTAMVKSLKNKLWKAAS